MKKVIRIKNLDCAACAAELSEELEAKIKEKMLSENGGDGDSEELDPDELDDELDIRLLDIDGEDI